MRARIDRRTLLLGAAALAGAALAASSPAIAAPPNPADYVDGLQRMGVVIFRARPGRWTELDPERMTPCQQAKAYGLRSFWMATPERRGLIVAELERRWEGVI